MQGLQQFLAFTETAKHGSFAAAAREVGTASSTLAKAVLRLEDSLGVKLFHRTTRQVTLTPDGERLYHRCQRVLAEIEDLHADAAGTRASATGLLRIDMPIVFGRRVILPLLARLQQQHPGLELDLRLQDGYVDLVKDGIDLAIRVGALQDSSLVARRFASQTLLLVAGPAYLAQHGQPTTLRALAQHRAIVFRMPTSGRDRPWQFIQRGHAITLHPTSHMRLNDGEGMVQAALLGQGIAQLPDYMVTDELADGRLVELLPSLRPAAMPISAVYPSQRLLPPRVRVVLDALTSS
ncbi:LysR family transcriptional regulator [Variovorax sp. JS1663]|uniref:LysR family transcriptional regulator n=1 Tax=Variovorax sp. JS1663 TaxID=1851577 RepID=UPI000B34174C|nr:LysR family transcriptional regulator [Variovorax sp. JS1663]OUM03358.1 LysR family transcriptional regulator [Variovorax sp. JS1663]